MDALKYLNNNNVMCFAATHDIELTEILQSYFRNVHFEEEMKDVERWSSLFDEFYVIELETTLEERLRRNFC